VGAVVINDVVGIVVDVVGIVVDVNICVVDCNDVTPFVVVDVDNVVIGVVSTVFVTMDEVLQRILEELWRKQHWKRYPHCMFIFILYFEHHIPNRVRHDITEILLKLKLNTNQST
jgi:hypothetical protein